MPKNTQHETMKNLTAKSVQGSVQKPGRKPAGTRIGLLIDWREGSSKTGVLSDRYGRSVRDGR